MKVLVDTGLVFNIIPYDHFSQLNIPVSSLDSSKKYSIQSATHLIQDAVLGTIK